MSKTTVSTILHRFNEFFAGLLGHIQSIWTRFRSDEDNVMCYASGLPKTHPILVGHVAGERDFVKCKTTYIRDREGEDDLIELLYAARQEVYARAVEAGGNALAEESWICNIKEKGKRFTVQVRYHAKAVVSRRPDPQEPVNLDDALAFDEEPHSGDFFRGRSSWYRKSLNPNEPRWNDARRVSILEMSQSSATERDRLIYGIAE